MKLRQLEVLNAILQTGSITGAAKLLSVSQPSISTVLQQFEAHLGIQLFERTGGRIKPSPEALALLPEIRDIFRRVDRVAANARLLAHGRLGRISIAGTLALANGYLIDAASTFRKHYPDVELIIHSLQTPDIIERVIAQEIDIGVCYGPVDGQALKVEGLAVGELICVVPVEHALARLACVTPADLSEQSIITYVSGDTLRAKVEALFEGVATKPTFGIQVSQTITAIRLVSTGAGIALIEPFFFAAMRPAGLVARPLRPNVSFAVEIIRSEVAVESVVISEFLRILHATTAGP